MKKLKLEMDRGYVEQPLHIVEAHIVVRTEERGPRRQ